jgi:hypothetical protein
VLMRAAMNYGWNERREFSAYLRRRFWAHDRLVAKLESERFLAERVMQSEMERKNVSVRRINDSKREIQAVQKQNRVDGSATLPDVRGE